MVNYVDMVKRLVKSGMTEAKALQEVAHAYCLDLKMLEASYRRETH